MKHFHLGAASGIIATAAQANDVLFAWHNNAANCQHIQRIRARANVVAKPGTGAEYALELALATFGSDYTDGQNLSDPATAADYAIRNRNLDKLRVLQTAWRPQSSLASGNVRIASTADLTAGATPPTIDAHAFARQGEFLAAAADTTGATAIDLLWESPTLGQDYERPCDGCIPLEEDRGFVIRVPIVLLATLTLRLSVQVDWIET